MVVLSTNWVLGLYPPQPQTTQAAGMQWIFNHPMMYRIIADFYQLAVKQRLRKE